MPKSWIERRAHDRRLASGRVVHVGKTWECREVGSDRDGKAYQRFCPQCGAHIISVHMPKGGWAHFEGEPGLARSKHPCLHRGEGLSKRRDPQTADLFDQPEVDDPPLN